MTPYNRTPVNTMGQSRLTNFIISRKLPLSSFTFEGVDEGACVSYTEKEEREGERM